MTTTPTPEVLRLLSELRTERETNARLDAQLRELQEANEGHYREQYDATGGPAFDPAQPFGRIATGPRPYGSLEAIYAKAGVR